MKFRFVEIVDGWATAEIESDSSALGLAASYLSDALGNLLSALIELTVGAASSTCSWDLEPGEFRWQFAVAGQSATVTILRSRTQSSGGCLSTDGEWVFEANLPTVDLIRAVTNGAADVLATYGTSGYLERWGKNPFPTQELSTLRRWLEASH